MRYGVAKIRNFRFYKRERFIIQAEDVKCLSAEVVSENRTP
jgi:hypothetical protein